MEHRSSTNARHLTLFWAVTFASRHVSSLSSSSNILLRLQVCRGLPLLHFPFFEGGTVVSYSFLMEHRSSTNARHLTLFWAVTFASRHVSPLSSSSNILLRLQVCRGLPLLHFPCGFHSRAVNPSPRSFFYLLLYQPLPCLPSQLIVSHHLILLIRAHITITLCLNTYQFFRRRYRGVARFSIKGGRGGGGAGGAVLWVPKAGALNRASENFSKLIFGGSETLFSS